MPEPAEKTYVIRFKEGLADKVKAHEVEFLEGYLSFKKGEDVIAMYKWESVCGWRIEKANSQ